MDNLDAHFFARREEASIALGDNVWLTTRMPSSLCASFIEEQLGAVAQVANDKPEPVVPCVVPEVIAVRWKPAQPCAPGEVSADFAQEPADRHPRQITRLLPSLPLLDRPNEVIERIADELLGHIGHPDTVLSEDPAVVTSLVVVDPAEPFDVIHDDRTEGAILFLGVCDHCLKRFARGGLSAADRVISVPAKDVQTMFLSVLLERRALIVEGLFLPVS